MQIISEFETQFKLGQSSLSKIKLDYTSRDDITKLLLGIQHISLNKEGLGRIFQILEKTINIKSIGRSGMGTLYVPVACIITDSTKSGTAWLLTLKI